MIKEKEIFDESVEEKREKMNCETCSVNEFDQTVLQNEILSKTKRKDDCNHRQERSDSIPESKVEPTRLTKISRVSFKDEFPHVSGGKSEGTAVASLVLETARRLRTDSISGIAIINPNDLESEVNGTNQQEKDIDSEDGRFEKDTDSEDDGPLIGRMRANSNSSEVTNTSQLSLEIETNFQSSPISNPLFLKSEALKALNCDDNKIVLNSSKSEDEGRTEIGKKVACQGSLEKLKGPSDSLDYRPRGSLPDQPDYFHIMHGNYEEKYLDNEEERSTAESESRLGPKNLFREKGKHHERYDINADHENESKNSFREIRKYEESGNIDADHVIGSNSIFRESGKYEESDGKEDEKPALLHDIEKDNWVGRGRSGTSAREEAQIGILKSQQSQINMSPSHVSFGDKALLNDIEKDDAPIMQRGQSVTNAEFSSVGRDRSNTEFVHINVFEKAQVATTWQKIFKRLASLWDVLTSSGLRHRPRLYVLLFLFVCLTLLSDERRNPIAWFRFYGIALALDVCTALADQFFFVFIIDKIFEKHFNIAYMLRGFHGPIGLLATLLIITAGGLELEVAENFGPWRSYVAGIITVLICICIKNYYVRQHYVALLQDKFADKLFQLQTWTILLSELATTKPPKIKGTKTEQSKIFKGQIIGSDFLRTVGSVGTAVIRPGSVVTSKVKNVFADIVASSNLIRGSDSKTTERGRPGNRNAHKRHSFWSSAAKLSREKGTLYLSTYDGAVAIRKRIEAEAFGSLLYAHLSREGRKKVTPSVLEKLFKDRDEKHYDKTDYSVIDLTTKEEKETAVLLFESALQLLDPLKTADITEDQCVGALCRVYKEYRFAATSLNDYGELHSSLIIVIDIIFWIGTIVILQVFIQIDLLSYILPFLTIVLAASFALSSLVGNIFLSVAFVFFMQPFEVGNKIAVGDDPSSQIVGFVRAISLMYTTICKLNNVVLRIPNHVLFNSKITNYNDSFGALYEVKISFNVFENKMVSPQAVIDLFFLRVKDYCLIDEKKDWQSFAYTCSVLNVIENRMDYSVWVNHIDNLQDFGRSLGARTRLIQFMAALQREMKISFVRIRQPVNIEEFERTKDEVFS